MFHIVKFIKYFFSWSLILQQLDHWNLLCWEGVRVLYWIACPKLCGQRSTQVKPCWADHSSKRLLGPLTSFVPGLIPFFTSEGFQTNIPFVAQYLHSYANKFLSPQSRTSMGNNTYPEFMLMRLLPEVLQKQTIKTSIFGAFTLTMS